MKTAKINAGFLVLAACLLAGCLSHQSAATNEEENLRQVGVYDASLSLADYLKREGGVVVQERDGETIVRIRGNISFENNSSPLFVIDGIRSGQDYDRVARLVPVENILSIRVLKGSDSSSLYGLAGSNGAIVIRTKHS